MRNVLIVLHKEFLEITQLRGLVAGILAPAIILTVVPLASVAGAAVSKGDASSGLGSSSGIASLSGLTAAEASQAFVGMEVSVLFLLMPSLLTSIIAAYAIIGEKTGRTLEPLLATPIRTWELLVGKGLASVLPGVALTWLSGSIFLYGLARTAVSERVFSLIASPGWYITFFIWTPLIAVVAIGTIIMLSSRVNDPRAAQQLASAVVLPFLVIFLGQASGWIVLGVGIALFVAAVLLVLALGCTLGAVIMFRRDVILTRWK